MSLACSDCLVGAGLPLQTLVHNYKATGLGLLQYPCIFSFAVTTFTLGMSCLNLLGICVERYVCIQHPFRYIEVVNKFRIKVIIAGIWIYGFLLCAVVLFVTNNWIEGPGCTFINVFNKGYFYVLMLHVLVYLVAIAVLNILVARTARKVQLQIKEEQERYAEKKSKMKEVNVSMMMGLVTLCFCISWFPFVATYIGRAILGNKEPLWLEYTGKASLCLAFANSCQNFIIYGWKSKEFRRAFKRMFCCKINQVGDESSAMSMNARKKSK